MTVPASPRETGGQYTGSPSHRLPSPVSLVPGVAQKSLLTRKTEDLGLEPMPVGDLGQTDSLALLSVGPSWTDGGW